MKLALRSASSTACAILGISVKPVPHEMVADGRGRQVGHLVALKAPAGYLCWTVKVCHSSTDPPHVTAAHCREDAREVALIAAGCEAVAALRYLLPSCITARWSTGMYTTHCLVYGSSWHALASV